MDEENVTLRIHRGNKSNNHRSDLPISSSTSNLDTLRANQSSSGSNFERKRRFGSSRCREKVMISVSYPSNDQITSPTISTSSNQVIKEPISLKKSNSSDCSNFFKEGRQVTKTESLTNNNLHKKASKRSSSGVKVQVRKFRMETKAAKTLAIIVGKCRKRLRNMGKLSCVSFLYARRQFNLRCVLLSYNGHSIIINHVGSLSLFRPNEQLFEMMLKYFHWTSSSLSLANIRFVDTYYPSPRLM